MKKLTCRLHYIVIFILCISSCNVNNETEIISVQKKTISVNLSENDKISVFDLWKNIEIIPLETNNVSVINSFNKIKFLKNKFYILDHKQNALFVFYENGNLSQKIQRSGVGPGEYILLSDYNINKYTGEIELLNPRGSIMLYDSVQNFIKKIDIPSQLPESHFFSRIVNDTTILFSLYSEYMLQYYSGVSDSIFNRDVPGIGALAGTQLVSGRISPFYSYNDKIIFFNSLDCSSYYVETDTIKHKLSYDFGEYNLKYTDLPEEEDLQFYVNHFLTGKSAYGFSNYIENDSLVIFRFVHRRIWHTLIHDKATDNIQIVKKFSENVVFPGIFDFFEDGIVALVDPNQIEVLINPEMLNEKNLKIFEDIKEDDNPILIKYYFK